MGLARLLDDQKRRMDQLCDLMNQEQSQLTQGQVDGKALSSLAERKQHLLGELERIEKLRRDVQQRLGYPAGGTGARRAAEDASCQAQWDALLERSERVARVNELTGQMLALRMTHNQQMLDYIRDVAEKTLYSANGRNLARPGRLNTSA